MLDLGGASPSVYGIPVGWGRERRNKANLSKGTHIKKEATLKDCCLKQLVETNRTSYTEITAPGVIVVSIRSLEVSGASFLVFLGLCSHTSCCKVIRSILKCRRYIACGNIG